MNAPSSLLAQFSAASPVRRWTLVIGLLVVAACVAVAGWLLLRPSYEVMFSGLRRQDAAAITAELEKQKIPFRYDEQNAAILVPRGDSRATRLKLMSRDLRLQGVVGLELFNNSDLGLTEFAQKVNYQRALQGELARTIMTLDEIDLARVHITLPDSSLFRRDNARPKASVALFLRDGQSLSAESIRGIQRLVAASVPELSPADVSVLDASGAPASASSGEIDDPGLQLKQAIERNYERKIAAMIASVVGDGHASVSVEAAINTDQVRATHESTLTRPSSGDNGSAGVPLPVARSMPETGRPPLPSLQASSNGPREEARTVRDLEQVIKSPGAVRRLSVGIVFDRALPQEQLTQLTTVISTAIGLDAARGDVLSTFVRDGKQTPSGTETDERTIRESAGVPPVQTPAASSLGSTRTSFPYAAMLAIPALLLVVLLWGKRKRFTPVARLTEAQRDQHLARLRSLLAIEEHARDQA